MTLSNIHAIQSSETPFGPWRRKAFKIPFIHRFSRPQARNMGLIMSDGGADSSSIRNILAGRSQYSRRSQKANDVTSSHPGFTSGRRINTKPSRLACDSGYLSMSESHESRSTRLEEITEINLIQKLYNLQPVLVIALFGSRETNPWR